MHCRGEPARPSYLCDDVRPTHDNPSAKDTLPNISSSSHTSFGRAGPPLHWASYDTDIVCWAYNVAHSLRAGRARPYITLIRTIGFVSGKQFTSRYKNNLKNSTSGPTLLSSKQNKKSGVMSDPFVYFFFHTSCNQSNFSGFSRMYLLTLNNSSSLRNTRS